MKGAKLGEVRLSCLNKKLLDSRRPAGKGSAEAGREVNAGLCETRRLDMLIAGSGSMMGDSAERLIMGEVTVVAGEIVDGDACTSENAGETSALPREDEEE